MSILSGPHLDTGQWLKKLELKEYGSLFKNYRGVEELLSLSERELKNLGIKNGSHRARMMTSLVILKDKYERADIRLRSLTAPNSVRHSFALNRDSIRSSPCFRTHRLSVPNSRNSSVRSSCRCSLRFSMEPMTGSEASPEELKKALEWELSLDNSDLRSHAWYHGTIPRQRAEELMSEEGDFLIRDCISRPGDYVLTCRWRGAPLHFVINKVVFQPFTVYEKIQYQFEDDCFDTVPDLVTYYVGNKRPISAASGAVVSRPVNRSMPLSYYATRYGLECQMHYAALALEKVAGQDGGSPVRSAHGGSHENVHERRSSQPPEIPAKLTDEHHTYLSGASTMPRSSQSSGGDYPSTIPSMASNFSTLKGHHQHATYPSGTQGKPRITSDPCTSPTIERKSLDIRPQSGPSEQTLSAVGSESLPAEDRPPPKPSRIPSKRYDAIRPSAKNEPTAPVTNIISNTGSGDSNLPSHLYSEPTYPDKSSTRSASLPGSDPVRIPNSTSISDLKKNVKEKRESLHDGSNGLDSQAMTVPELNPPSGFDLSAFTTTLLQSENKPLDPPALARIRCMILEGGPRVIASHLTKVDLDVLRVSGKDDLGLGVVTGFELLLLPQGQQLRLDLLERTESLKFFVAITILTCGDEDVRAQVLNKWIQIAIETKTALGNLYGFTGIMQGLALPQISRLRSTWLKLRQACTENALTYETKLRPTLKSMQECSNPQAPNTCIPYLLSLVVILQRHLEAVLGKEETNGETPNTSTLDSSKGKIVSLDLPWEHTASDYGLQLLLIHLEAGRSITQHWPTYRRNSEIVLENAKYDDIMIDIFRTEFQLKFLWGSKGSHVTAKERYSKFLQVLNVMSERCEAS